MIPVGQLEAKSPQSLRSYRVSRSYDGENSVKLSAGINRYAVEDGKGLPADQRPRALAVENQPHSVGDFDGVYAKPD
jgi:hypothetical protein